MAGEDLDDLAATVPPSHPIEPRSSSIFSYLDENESHDMIMLLEIHRIKSISIVSPDDFFGQDMRGDSIRSRPIRKTVEVSMR